MTGIRWTSVLGASVLVVAGASAGETQFRNDVFISRVTNMYPRARGDDDVSAGRVGPVVPLGDRLLFGASDEKGRRHLWRRDPDGRLSLVTDKLDSDRVVFGYPGYWSVDGMGRITTMNGAAYFQAADAATGVELWRSDGTDAGTVLIRDIRPGAADGVESVFGALNGRVLFEAADGAGDRTLWATDGTSDGTTPLVDASIGRSPRLVEQTESVAYYTIDEPVVGRRRLWRSDGTPSGTFRIADVDHDDRLRAVVLGDVVCFWARAGSGRRLYATSPDGLAVELLHDFPSVASDWLPPGHVLSSSSRVGDWLYFFGDDGIHGNELWRTDGTPQRTLLVKDVTPGPVGTDLHHDDVSGSYGDWRPPVATDSRVWFVNHRDSDLWMSDGTDAGTVPLSAVHAGFAGRIAGGQVLRLDGASVLFDAYRLGTEPNLNVPELWRTDGTDAGTVRLADVSADLKARHSIVRADGSCVFRGFDVSYGLEPWFTDGTPVGTFLLADIEPGPDSYDPHDFLELDGVAYFVARLGDDVGEELCKLVDVPVEVAATSAARGAEIVIKTAGIGRSAGAVRLVSGRRRVAMKVTEWDEATGEIRALLNRPARAGVYDVVVAKRKGRATTARGAFEILAPVVRSPLLDGPEGLSFTADHVGTAAPRVFLADPVTLRKRACRVTHRRPASGGPEGTLEIFVKVPERLRTGVDYDLVLTNDAGASTFPSAFHAP